MNGEIGYELTVEECVPCKPYLLSTMIHFGILDFQKALEVAGIDSRAFKLRYGHPPRESTLGLGYVIYSDLATRLSQHAQIPEDKIVIFGDNFSKIVRYNEALKNPILTEEDGVSKEFKTALFCLDYYLTPFGHRIASSVERVLRERYSREFEIALELSDYMRESLTAGEHGEGVERFIGKKLDELTRRVSLTLSSNRDAQQYLPSVERLDLVKQNPEFVFRNYTKAAQLRNKFRDQFREQIGALANLFNRSEWEETGMRNYSVNLIRFLTEPLV